MLNFTDKPVLKSLTSRVSKDVDKCVKRRWQTLVFNTVDKSMSLTSMRGLCI